MYPEQKVQIKYQEECTITKPSIHHLFKVTPAPPINKSTLYLTVTSKPSGVETGS